MTKDKRKEQYGKSIRQGMIKEGIDRGLKKFASKITDAIGPVIGLATETDVTDPVVAAGLEFAIIQTVAEIFAASGHVAHKLPGLDLTESDARARMEALSGYLRSYSGERVGDEVAQYAVSYLPVVKKLITDASMAGVFDNNMLPEASEQVSLSDLIDADEDQDN